MLARSHGHSSHHIRSSERVLERAAERYDSISWDDGTTGWDSIHHWMDYPLEARSPKRHWSPARQTIQSGSLLTRLMALHA